MSPRGENVQYEGLAQSQSASYSALLTTDNATDSGKYLRGNDKLQKPFRLPVWTPPPVRTPKPQ